MFLYLKEMFCVSVFNGNVCFSIIKKCSLFLYLKEMFSLFKGNVLCF